jgi:hypothetical protein
MTNEEWIDLIQLFPPQFHDNLVLTTQNGKEINVQHILRIEREYLVVRGRAAGSTDEGRPFFVPYDQITFHGMYRPVKDAQVLELYGERAPAADEGPQEMGAPAAVAEPLPEVKPQAVEKPTPRPTLPPAPAPAPSAVRPSLANKAAILERLRSTGRGAGQQTPKPPDK